MKWPVDGRANSARKKGKVKNFPDQLSLLAKNSVGNLWRKIFRKPKIFCDQVVQNKRQLVSSSASYFLKSCCSWELWKQISKMPAAELDIVKLKTPLPLSFSKYSRKHKGKSYPLGNANWPGNLDKTTAFSSKVLWQFWIFECAADDGTHAIFLEKKNAQKTTKFVSQKFPISPSSNKHPVKRG